MSKKIHMLVEGCESRVLCPEKIVVDEKYKTSDFSEVTCKKCEMEALR
jgi:hypothetical protein